MSSDARDELKRRITNAKADLDERRGSMLNDMDLIYVDPIGAAKKITGFVKEHGEKALIKQLQDDPARFGTTKGKLGSPTFLKSAGFSERAVAKEYAQTLPAKASALQAAENKLYDLQRALHGDTQELAFGPSRTRSGPDR